MILLLQKKMTDSKSSFCKISIFTIVSEFISATRSVYETLRGLIALFSSYLLSSQYLKKK